MIGNNRTKVFSDGSPARGRLGQQEAEPSRSYPALARPLPGGERVPPLGAEQEDADTTHERYDILPNIYIPYTESESALILSLPCELVFGSQFFDVKLLQVAKKYGSKLD